MRNKDRSRRDDTKKRNDEAPVIHDPRFAGLHSDPRFQKLPKSRLKLPLDPRFQRMFSDKAFVDPFSLDKRGKPVQKQKKSKHTLERYYRIEDTTEDPREKEAIEENVYVKEPEVSEAKTSESSGEDSESSSSPESSSSEADLEEKEDEEEEEEEEKVATTDKETKRLAVVNMDWSCIKAIDLLMLFNSFLPKGGNIVSVAVYPSQFGLEQMKKEDVHGPSVFDSKQDDDQEGEVDMEKLRAYEKSKLRYYYALVTCDSVSTASALYTSCDGIEFERTSNILDLQFVPDDREFNVEPRDVASEVVEGYEAPDFQTGALQLSNVKLTWDDDEPVRVKRLQKFNPDQLKEMDFKAYLASEDESENDDGVNQSRRDKFRALLLDDKSERLDSKKKDVDMEITFPSGLEELNKKYLERKKKNEGEETIWEAQLRKNKEKRLEKKTKGKHEANEAPKVPGDANGFNDPFFNSDLDEFAGDSASEDENLVAARPTKVEGEERKKKREERELKKKEEERNRAELELLLLDENGGNGGAKGYNLKKNKKKAKSKTKEAVDAKSEEHLSMTDFNDPRFSALFTSHHFAIDPTDPQFKRSATKLRALAEMQQKRFQEQQVPVEPKPVEKKEKLELSSMVRSLKRKAGT